MFQIYKNSHSILKLQYSTLLYESLFRLFLQLIDFLSFLSPQCGFCGMTPCHAALIMSSFCPSCGYFAFKSQSLIINNVLFEGKYISKPVKKSWFHNFNSWTSNHTHFCHHKFMMDIKFFKTKKFSQCKYSINFKHLAKRSMLANITISKDSKFIALPAIKSSGIKSPWLSIVCVIYEGLIKMEPVIVWLTTDCQKWKLHFFACRRRSQQSGESAFYYTW